MSLVLNRCQNNQSRFINKFFQASKKQKRKWLFFIFLSLFSLICFKHSNYNLRSNLLFSVLYDVGFVKKDANIHKALSDTNRNATLLTK